MSQLFSEIKKTDNANYVGSPGNFKPFMTGTWELCRVTFHEAYYKLCNIVKKPPGFIYVHKAGQSNDSLHALLSEVENKIGLAVEDQVTLTPTQHNTAVHVMPSEWWNDPVRFTLLTCLLRDNAGTVEKTKEGRYMKPTSAAFDRFLQGNTFYHYDTYQGWLNSLRGDKASKMQNKPYEKDVCLVEHHIGWTKYPIKLARR